MAKNPTTTPHSKDPLKFGDMVVLVKPQSLSRDIPNIKLGTKCVVIEVVNTPGYDLLVVPEGYILHENGQDWRTVYLERGCWEVQNEK